ncbi:MAPEG family protein [Mesorhizobium sp. M1060]|uniref:MAPEG family protein n=1 Tax=unclassified Mesorhizobium TaxID=325217 RepID=UPI0003CF979B|nr:MULTISPECIES: MAPEG family protein [unclassified Mesorhizobium]ESW84295.1 hypothetical protein X770_24065 [Mesorhizobium sp. LSJC269B00]ESX09277.1 hypothetical protein X768_18820 [Mesorhizobium sp. LSJC265A00]ESZ07790.1 hypothetical protein X736_10220 [Mesorhizobium sp. L2C089B000]WJI51980.1 MAPEG family protein [Mesorhizobium sp. C089B]
MSASAYALTGFISWALALLIVMEVIRSYLVISGQVPANGFTPDNGALSPFMRRLARACIEGLPIFGGLLGVAIIISKTDVTDPLASTMLGARIVQSVIHLVSTSQLAVSLRFTAFAVQMVIGAYWCWLLLI